ncbi:MAG TPA: TDT family transporter [Candidatus Aphodovivens avistercoris]|nr:TDT family transporter [Candidatus Aphodovivens avistercoris]
MRTLIKSVPIPAAGVALGLAALGNLLQPHAEAAHVVCGVLSLCFVALLVAKIVLFPGMIRDDLKNSIFASVSATLFMTLMQLATYLAPALHQAAFALWCAAVAGHLVLMAWFTVRYILHFKLAEVFPTYFICYVGIVVASVTCPAFGMQAVGQTLFWFGFFCYLVLLVVVSARYVKHEIPEAARPLFCIYTAPMSLSLAGYLSCMEQPNAAFVVALLVLAQLLLVLVLARLPLFMKLRFYPSFAAMTFPFVITATALGKATAFLREAGLLQPGALSVALDVLLVAETVLACAMVLFVTVHYARFFVRSVKTPDDVAVKREGKLAALIARGLQH